MARFFIDRPIFAWVLAIIISLAGLLSIHQLSIEQYPDIAPPKVSISTTYPGASGETVEQSVTQVIEQAMTGIDNLQDMSSTSASDGRARIQLEFIAGTNPDVAEMQVQNKVNQILSRLPQSVQDQGVTVDKSGTDYLMFVTLSSDNPEVTSADLGDYISSNLNDIISRLNGVGETQVMGASYAMRIWLNPDKLEKYSLMPSDIETALTYQNTQVSAGALGALPAAPGQQLYATITSRSKLHTIEEFKNIIVKSSSDGTVVHLSDVARVAMGQASYTIQSTFDGKPAASLGIKLGTGANSLDVSKEVQAKLKQLEPFFPNQIKAHISYDTTPFIQVSIHEVVITLIEAMLLVIAVMYLFMQNLRATLIPAIAVPVVLLGTFGILAAFGYTINTLTMFGLVLAIGLLVDDAIVVVENVERIMHEKKCSAKEATRESMKEITGALVGIALVLSAVFIPMAFFGGTTGIIYRQFSITIVSSMLLSVFVAMTLSPAMCASIMTSSMVDHKDEAPRTIIGRFFAWFNRVFHKGGETYRGGVGYILHRSKRFLFIYAIIIGVLAIGFIKLPTSFLPDEDQGVLMALIKLPSGATYNRTQVVIKQFEAYLDKQPEVADEMAIVGIDGDQASARAFIKLKDWSERKGDGKDAASLARKYTQALSTIRDARIFIVLPPVVHGLGDGSGFTIDLQDNGNLGHEALVKARDQFLQLARANKKLENVRISGLDDVSQFSIDIDDAKAVAMNLSASDINSTMNAALGGVYVNDFINNTRVKKVYMQGDAPYRMNPEDIMKWYVRNSDDDMVPFSAFATTNWTFGPPRLERYNGISSYEIVGQPAAGVSSGVAMDEVEKIAAQLPQGIGFSWAAQSYQERLAGSQAPALYAISILFVFLCLAALYESWSVPFSIILVVPIGVVGAVLTTWAVGLDNDVYFQIGLLTTVGLSAKNAILIVEFAKTLQEKGMSLIDAAMEAVRLRFRPILMTSLAFIFGTLPLALATGAGSGSRRALGTGVVGGMFFATVLELFFVPLFFVLIRGFFARRKTAKSVALPASAKQGEE